MTKKTAYKFLISLVCLLVITISGFSYTVLSQKDSSQVDNTKTDKVSEVKSILVELDKRMYRDSLLKCEMEVWENNSRTEHFLLTNKTKNNNQKILTRYQYPPQWVDTSVLMVNEDVWIYDGKSDRYMQMPANLAFGGTGLSHGDIMRLNISNNYDGNIVAETTDTWTVKLSTTNKAMPYYLIEIVINKEEYYPITMKCYSNTKKLIKTIEYSDVKEVNGVMKPTKYKFISPFETDTFSVIKIIDEKLIEYPEHIFDKWVLGLGIDEK
jgi:hypothetical protein